MLKNQLQHVHKAKTTLCTQRRHDLYQSKVGYKHVAMATSIFLFSLALYETCLVLKLLFSLMPHALCLHKRSYIFRSVEFKNYLFENYFNYRIFQKNSIFIFLFDQLVRFSNRSCGIWIGKMGFGGGLHF